MSIMDELQKDFDEQIITKLFRLKPLRLHEKQFRIIMLKIQRNLFVKGI